MSIRSLGPGRLWVADPESGEWTDLGEVTKGEIRLAPTWKGLTAGQLVRHVEALDITLVEARRLLEEAAADEAYEHAAALRDLIKGRESP